MKTNKLLGLVLISIIIFSTSTTAQKAYTAEADQAFKMNQYYEAVTMYKKAYANIHGNPVEKKRVLFQIAECNRLTNNVKKAEAVYRRVILANYPDPIAVLYYADALKMQEKYDLAKREYEKYKQKVPDDPRGDLGIKSCELAQTWIDNPRRYQVKPIKKINSSADDFSPSYVDKNYKEMVFTSTREDAIGSDQDQVNGMSFSDIFQVSQDVKQNWSTPQLFEKESINSEYNEGTATFNSKANTIYFTRCIVKKNQKLGCGIYKSNKQGRNWAESELLPLASDSFTIGHPAISKDEKTIYFASDIPGGYGGKDIWVAKRSKKTKAFGAPKNLGPIINTSGDEMFPYLKTDNSLYFSSNGHLGMGGLDIFVSNKEEGKWSEPVNLQYPLNSSSDDFGICFNLHQKQLKKEHADEMGFFTTNRKGGRGGDDIWSFLLPEIVFTLQGTVKDENTLQLLKDVKVTLSGSDKTYLETMTDEKGNYHFNKEQILKNTTYTLNFTKKEFFENKAKETTIGIFDSKDLILNINLTPLPINPNPLPEIQYDLDSFVLKAESKDSLNGLFNMLSENSRLVIELMSHTDSRGSHEKNDLLSQNRAKSVVDYLVTKGISADRMIPKGYGKRKARKLEHDYTFTTGDYKGISFPKGVTLSDDYINSLKTYKEKEAAHQLNRRTEFRILRDDYVPKASNDTINSAKIQIEVNPEDNIIELLSEGDDLLVPCYLLDKTMSFKFEREIDTMQVSIEVINDFLKVHKIDKTSFVKKEIAFEDDGTVKEGSVLVFRKMLIGSKEVENIYAKVVKDLPFRIIMGEDDLNRFGNFYIYEDEGKLEFE
ncbi:MAG: OmpA family protein [Saprospiraceae bacterium]|nr:OmpA family protein [Saprospiraceae bacterium]